MPHIPKRHLDRRAFLKAGAATLALPLLDAMIPFGRAAAAVAATPRRMVILDRPLGTYAPYFFPEKAGIDYEAPRLLKILEPQRGQFTVFSGMSHLGYPNDHRTEFALLNGVHPDNIKRMDDMHLGITLDQFVAQHVGGQTRVPYLLLGNLGGRRSSRPHTIVVGD